MKIAQIAPLVERVPPKAYGGTERVISVLTEELIHRGHEVTLFASADSITNAKLISVCPVSLREAQTKDLVQLNFWTQYQVGLAYARQGDFDIIHDHNGFWSLPTANLSSTPVVSTIHGKFDVPIKKIFGTLSHPYLVTISKSQGKMAKDLNHIATVYNGLPMEDYPFSEGHDEYLLYVGRISEEKGVHHAIEVARRVKRKLIIAAKLDVVDVEYFEKKIKPYLSPDIEWIGEVDETSRNKLMSRAYAFLHPVTWEEPFGLTLIEAGACGCPVLAFGKGSIPEIIKHGETGFISSSVEEMCAHVKEVERIDRRVCRSHVLENFSAEKMAEGYEEVYKKILSKKRP
jgi:glycosyltransferase involved in cell wall biosynthesis